MNRNLAVNRKFTKPTVGVSFAVSVPLALIAFTINTVKNVWKQRFRSLKASLIPGDEKGAQAEDLSIAESSLIDSSSSLSPFDSALISPLKRLKERRRIIDEEVA